MAVKNNYIKTKALLLVFFIFSIVFIASAQNNSHKKIIIPGSDIVIKVGSPKDIVYFQKKVKFNISTGEVAKKIEYINLNDSNPRWKNICLSCPEYGLYREKKLTMIEGENNLIIRVIDLNGGVSEKNVTFKVESEKPIVYKVEPRENSIVNGSRFFIQYTEYNLKNITLVYGTGEDTRNTTQACEPGKDKECIFSVNLSDYEEKTLKYYFIIEDLINSEKTQIKKLKVDTIFPVLEIELPEENKSYEKVVPFKMSISKKATLEYKNKDGKAGWKNLCTNCNQFGVDEKKTKIFQKGYHELLIRAVDKAGNSDLKEVNFYID